MQQILNFETPTIICETQTLISKLRNLCQNTNLTPHKQRYAVRQVQQCLNLVGEPNESRSLRDTQPDSKSEPKPTKPPPQQRDPLIEYYRELGERKKHGSRS